MLIVGDVTFTNSKYNYYTMSWSREHVRVLINEYKRHPCLCAVKTKSYMNKHAKHGALSNILGVLQQIRPGVTISEIKTKYAGLKATFLTEYKTYKDSLGTGKEEDEIYHPTLWYFEDFIFVLDHCEPRIAVASLDGEIAANEENDSQIETEEMTVRLVNRRRHTYIVNTQSGCLEPYYKEIVDHNLHSDDEWSSQSRPASSLSGTPRASNRGPRNPGPITSKQNRGTKRQVDDTA